MKIQETQKEKKVKKMKKVQENNDFGKHKKQLHLKNG